MELTLQLLIILFFGLLLGLVLGWFLFGLSGKKRRTEYEERIAGLEKDALYERELTQQRVLSLEADVTSANAMIENQDAELKKRDERLETLAQKLSSMRESSANMLGEDDRKDLSTNVAAPDENLIPRNVKQSLLTSILPLADEAADAQRRILKVKDDEIIRLQSQLSAFHETSQNLQERENEVNRLREQMTLLEGIEAILEQRDASLLQLQSQMDRLIPFERAATTLQQQLNEVQTRSKLALAEKDYQVQRLQSEVQEFSQFREKFEQNQVQSLVLQQEANRTAELEATLKAREQDIERLQKQLDQTNEKHQTEFENIRQRLSAVSELEGEIAARDERLEQLEQLLSENRAALETTDENLSENRSADFSVTALPEFESQQNSFEESDEAFVESLRNYARTVSSESNFDDAAPLMLPAEAPAVENEPSVKNEPSVEENDETLILSEVAEKNSLSSDEFLENDENKEFSASEQSSAETENDAPLYVAKVSDSGIIETELVENLSVNDAAEHGETEIKSVENEKRAETSDEKTSDEKESGFFAGLKAAVSSIFSSDKNNAPQNENTEDALKEAAQFSRRETKQSRDFQNSFFNYPESAETLKTAKTSTEPAVDQSAREEIERGEFFDDGYQTSSVAEGAEVEFEKTDLSESVGYNFDALKIDEAKDAEEDFEQPTQMFALSDIAADIMKHASVDPELTDETDEKKDEISFKETIESMSEEKKNLLDERLSAENQTPNDASQSLQNIEDQVVEGEQGAKKSSAAEQAAEAKTDTTENQLKEDETIFPEGDFDNEMPLAEDSQKSSVSFDDAEKNALENQTHNAANADETAVNQTDKDAENAPENAAEISEKTTETDAEDNKSAEKSDVSEEYIETEFARFLAQEELPALPSDDRIQLLLQSPTRILLYWTLGRHHFSTLQKAFGARAAEYTPAVRLTEKPQRQTRLHTVEERGEFWFNDVAPDTEFFAEIGFYAPNTPFISILKSNKVSTPRLSPSHRTASDEEFFVRPAEFAEILAASGLENETESLRFETATRGEADERTREVLALLEDEKETAEKTFPLDLLEIRWVLVSLAAGAALEAIKDSVSPETAEWLAETSSENLSAENVRRSLAKIVGEEFAQNIAERQTEKKFSNTMRVFGASSYAFETLTETAEKSLPHLFPVIVKSVFGGSSHGFRNQSHSRQQII